MADELRLLVIHVEEPDPGRFEWVITELHSPERLTEIDRATRGRDSYREAMADGLVSLEEKIDDLDVGPRDRADRSDMRQKDSKDQGRPTQAKAETGSPTSRTTPKTSAYFGFGPIR
jgi:hypothetical protein